MPAVTTSTERRDGVTYVRAVVENDRSTRQRIRCVARVDGSIRTPPSPDGVDGAWDGDTWTGVLAPGERRGFGFATPAEPDPPIVAVASSSRRSAESPSRTHRVLERLEDPRPPGRVLASGGDE